jgi:hypothetical protein
LNWDALGAIAEFAGALGVIASLAYLAVQIRQNSRVTSMNAGHSIANGIATFLERISLDPEFHSIWARGLSPTEELDQIERGRFGRLLTALYIRLYDAERHGKLDPEISRRYGHLARYYLRFESVQAWWGRQSENVRSFNPEVAAFIDECLAEVRAGPAA